MRVRKASKHHSSKQVMCCVEVGGGELGLAEKESEEGLWDYKLTEDGEEHGPFTTAQMAEWSSQVSCDMV